MAVDIYVRGLGAHGHIFSETGTPFVYLLRDFLQFDKDVWDSVKRLEGANRTCNLILGVGDGKTGVARGFASSAGKLLVFDVRTVTLFFVLPYISLSRSCLLRLQDLAPGSYYAGPEPRAVQLDRGHVASALQRHRVLGHGLALPRVHPPALGANRRALRCPHPADHHFRDRSARANG
jgi:hypothetical protein